MSPKKIELALAFLKSHPGAAARLLEEQPLDETVRFLADVPHPQAAVVLSRMLPQFTAKICARLEAETGAAFLSKMEVSLVAAVLRHSSAELRARLQGLLPEKTRLACQILLHHSEHTVGAWMIPQVSTLPHDCRVEDALRRLAADDAFVDLDAVYVVDRDGVLQGSLHTRSLLGASAATAVTSLMRRNPRCLFGRTTLESAASHIGWRSRDALPVVNRKNQFVGVIRHVDMRKGLQQLARPPTPSGEGGLFAIVFRAYASCFVAMANTLGEPPRP